MKLPTLGIDIAKAKFDCSLLMAGSIRQAQFANNVAGFKQLQRWLQKNGAQKVHACMEATGRYFEEVALFLIAEGHQVSVVNPARVKHYGRAQLSRNKNDQVDAALLAQFCAKENLQLWEPARLPVRELQELTRLLSHRKRQLNQEQNRLESGVKSRFVQQEIKRGIKTISRAIERMEAAIKLLIMADPELSHSAKLLCSIDGIGEPTAAVILAELPDIRRFHDARQAAAYAGLTPQQRESGTSLKGKSRLCKIGNPHLRRALYFPAMTAGRCNALLRSKAERLLALGKTKMCVIGALMHHLLRLAFGVLKNGVPFDSNWRPAR